MRATSSSSSSNRMAWSTSSLGREDGLHHLRLANGVAGVRERPLRQELLRAENGGVARHSREDRTARRSGGLEHAEYLRLVGEAAFPLLREDEAAVHEHVELARLALLGGGGGGRPPGDRGRETRGP